MDVEGAGQAWRSASDHSPPISSVEAKRQRRACEARYRGVHRHAGERAPLSKDSVAPAPARLTMSQDLRRSQRGRRPRPGARRATVHFRGAREPRARRRRGWRACPPLPVHALSSAPFGALHVGEASGHRHRQIEVGARRWRNEPRCCASVPSTCGLRPVASVPCASTYARGAARRSLTGRAHNGIGPRGSVSGRRSHARRVERCHLDRPPPLRALPRGPAP